MLTTDAKGRPLAFAGFLKFGMLSWRLVALGLCILWSTQFAVVHYVFEHAPGTHPSCVCLARFSIASVALLPTYYTKLIAWLRGDRSVAPLMRGASAMGGCMFIAFFGQATAMARGTTANKSAFIASLTAVWVPLLGGAQQGSWRGVRWMPIALAVAGIAVMELESATPSTADLWSFLQPVGFGTGLVLMESLAGSLGSSDDAWAVAGLRAVTLTACTFVWALAAGQGPEAWQSLFQRPVVPSLVFLGAVCSGCGWLVQTLVQSRVRAADFALILCLEPVFACLFSALLAAPGDGEGVSSADVLGGGLVVLGCAWNEVGALYRHQAAQVPTPGVVSGEHEHISSSLSV